MSDNYQIRTGSNGERKIIPMKTERIDHFIASEMYIQQVLERIKKGNEYLATEKDFIF